jgi:hypothetical protein
MDLHDGLRLPAAIEAKAESEVNVPCIVPRHRQATNEEEVSETNAMERELVYLRSGVEIWVLGECGGAWNEREVAFK